MLFNKWRDEYLSGKSVQTIANEYCTSYKIVRTRLLKLGVKFRTLSKTFTSEQTEDILHRYTNLVSANILAKEYNTSIQTIHRLLLKHNIKLSNLPTDYKFKQGIIINRAVFTDFTKEEDAYFYGLLLSDGCLVHGTNCVQLTLKSTDRDILLKYKNFLGTSKEITDKTDKLGYKSCTISFNDLVIKDSLVEQGFTPRKSLSETVPKFYNINSNVARHFWRGVIDGDGSVKGGKVGVPRTLSLIGSKELVNEFRLYCEMLCEKEVNIVEDKRHRNCYNLTLNGNRASIVAKELYRDTDLALIRKKVEADLLMSQINKYRYNQKE